MSQILYSLYYCQHLISVYIIKGKALFDKFVIKICWNLIVELKFVLDDKQFFVDVMTTLIMITQGCRNVSNIGWAQV